jgi:signal transduction histidine kinase/CheY-like chemotaxis protein
VTEENRRRLQELRARARELLRQRPESEIEAPEATEELLGELQVLHAELELQQQELIDSQLRAERSARHFAQLFHQAPIGFVRLDARQRIVESNQHALTLLELPLTREGTLWSHVLSYESSKTWDVLVAQVARGSAVGEITFRCPGGRRVIARTTVTRWAGATDGSGLLVTLDDMTNLRSFESAARRVQQRLAHLFDSVDDGVLTVRWAEGLIESANAAAARLFRTSVDELVGLPLARLLPYAMATLQVVLGEGSVGQRGRTVSLRFEPAGAPSVELECSLALIDDDAGRVLLLVARDVTARKQMEREREALLTRGFHAQQLESLGHLAAGVAHDFNNVLAAIVSCAGDLRTSSEPDVASAAADIESAATRGRELASSLLTLSREQPAQMTAVSLSAAVIEATRLLRRRLPYTVELSVRTMAEGDVVTGDAGQLVRALLNLGMNAVDALPNGGSLRFVVREETEALVVEVTDDGVGMTDEVKKAAFTPFFTTKQPGKGTGLGLAHAQSVADAHRATIELDSKPGRGTTVRLAFPRSRTTAGAAAAEGAAPTLRPLALHLLVVDDDALVLRGTLRTLRRLGCTTEGVTGGHEALRKVAAERFDAVLTDFAMPEMSGDQLIQALRVAGHTLPVVVLSGMIHEAYEVGLRAQGVSAVLRKPIADAQLHQALARLSVSP